MPNYNSSDHQLERGDRNRRGPDRYSHDDGSRRSSYPDDRPGRGHNEPRGWDRYDGSGPRHSRSNNGDHHGSSYQSEYRRGTDENRIGGYRNWSGGNHGDVGGGGYGGGARSDRFEQRDRGSDDGRGFSSRERRDAGSPYSGSPRGPRKESGPPGQNDFGWSSDGIYGRNPTMGGQPYYRNQGMNFNEDYDDRHRDGDRNYDRDYGRR